MNFPDSDRVSYNKNPLEAVICQFRFPPILKIDTNSLAAFQDAIRAAYPLYSSGPQINVPAGVPEDVAEVIMQDLSAMRGGAVHNFSSEDNVWKLSLTRDFIALTCHKKYVRWEEFKERFKGPFDALIAQYNPAFFTRVGLRYRNVIRKSLLGLAETSWSELLQPWLAGILAAPGTENSVEQTVSQSLIQLSDNHGRTQIHHGLLLDAATNELSYLIDSDFFCDQRMEVGNALERLNHFNKQARCFFRWAIKPKLHEAMEPQPITRSS